MNLRIPQILYAAPAGWIVYAILMVGLFLILTFPYDPLHATLLTHLSKHSGVEIRTERWAALWPAGIAWNQLSFVVPGLPPLQAEQVQLKVKLGSLLRGQPEFEGTGRLGAGQGLLKTQLFLASWSLTGPAQLLGTIEQLDLAKLPLPLIKKGTLRTQFEQRWSDLSHADKVWLGEGTWQVELSGLTLEQMALGPLVIPSLGISSLSGRVRCQAETCRIEALKGESPDGMLSGEGVLVPHEPFVTSHLSLTLSLTLSEALKQRLNVTAFVPNTPGLPFRVTLNGPLSNLQVAL